MKPLCPDCPPTRQISHANEWLQSFFLEIIDRFLDPLVPEFLKKIFSVNIMEFFLRSLLLMKIVREIEITPDLKIHPRTLQVAEEADKRGLKIMSVAFRGRATNLFVLKGKGKPYYFEGLPGYTPDFVTDIDHKEKAKKFLAFICAPIPKGKIFCRMGSALRFAQEEGFPLVVKPTHASLSRHVSVNIRNFEELKHAVKIAKKISFSFIVEEFLEGLYFRATAIGNKIYAVARRDAPEIQQQGTRGWKFNLDMGGTVTDVTDTVHPDNLMLFETIAEHVGLPTIGIDFIAPNISESWKNQKCGIIELNSLPAIDLHTKPIIHGVSRNLAGSLLDYVFLLWNQSKN